MTDGGDLAFFEERPGAFDFDRLDHARAGLLDLVAQRVVVRLASADLNDLSRFRRAPLSAPICAAARDVVGSFGSSAASESLAAVPPVSFDRLPILEPVLSAGAPSNQKPRPNGCPAVHRRGSPVRRRTGARQSSGNSGRTRIHCPRPTRRASTEGVVGRAAFARRVLHGLSIGGGGTQRRLFLIAETQLLASREGKEQEAGGQEAAVERSPERGGKTHP